MIYFLLVTTLIISAISIYQYIMCIFSYLIFKCSNVRDVLTMLIVYSSIFVLGDVRLVGTGLKHVGKVELRYQKEWGTVCDDSWGKVDADVICRMLGYKGAVTYIWYIEGETPRRMLLDDVGCSGNENSIADCTHDGWWTSNCNNKENAGVVCQTDGGKKYKYLLHYNCRNINKSKAII